MLNLVMLVNINDLLLLEKVKYFNFFIYPKKQTLS